MQLNSVKSRCNKVFSIFNTDKFKTFLSVLGVLCLSSLATRVFAGADLLAGTETALVSTLQGTGKKYLYIAECVVSLLAYIQTKNIMVLIGIIVVAVFFNIMLSLTGLSA